MIYKKIKKAKENLLKMNAIEAAQAGAKGTGIDLNKKEDESSSPITFSASPFKDTDPTKVEKKIVSHEGTAKDYIKKTVEGEDTYNTKSIDKAKSGGPLETDDQKYFKDLYGRFGDDVTTQQLIDKDFLHSSKLDAYNAFTGGKNKGVLTPGKSSANVTLTPRKEEIKTDPTQTYNMSYANSVNANMAEGAQRRGTRRAERRAKRDIRRYEQGSRGFLGIGAGKGEGELSANVVAAAEKTGLKADKLKQMGLNVNDKGSITGDADQNVTDQMRSRATNLSMNKYNQGLNEFSYKPGSSKTVNESGEGYEVYDGPVGDINTASNIDFSKFGKTDYAGNFKQETDRLLQGMTSFNGPTKKGYKGKNAKAFKNKSGRGAGY
jgi:hypothetical protein